MILEVHEHRLEIGDARGHGGVAIQSPGLAAPPKVEAREGEARLGKFPAEQEILVAVLAGAHPMAGHHTGHPSRRGQMENADHLNAVHLDAEALDSHAHTRSKSSQVLAEIWNITSSTGRPLILATSSATRETTHGPDGAPPNSP